MKMINVLEKLAELDRDNPNVVNPMVQKEAIAPKKLTPKDKPSAPHLKPGGEIDRDVPTVFRKGKTAADFDQKTEPKKDKVEECGPMGSTYTGPASLNISASASDPESITSMLHALMSLTGAHKVGPEHMPLSSTPGPSTVTSAPSNNDSPSMQDMIAMFDKSDDSMNPLPGKSGDDKPEAEGTIGKMVGAKLGDALTGEQKEESYDNTPDDPTDIPHDVPREYQPNKSKADLRRGSTNAPRGRYYKETFEDYKSDLYQEYQRFISEEK